MITPAKAPIMIFGGLFLALLCLALYLPAHTDEVYYKLINARLFTDGELIGLFPQCSQSFSLSVPTIWFLPRALDWFIYHAIENSFYIRTLGVAAFALLMALLYALTRQLGHSRVAFIAAACLLSLDVLPLLLTLNRPEQNIVLCLMGFVLLYLWAAKHSSYWRLGIICLLYLLLANYFFAQHPKASLFLPPVLLVGFFIASAKKEKWLAFLNMSSAVFFAAASLKIHILRTSCPEHEAVVEQFAEIYLSLSMLAQAPLEFIAQAFLNLLQLPDYFLNLWYRTRYIPDWLPQAAHELNGFYRMLDSGFAFVLACILCGLFLILLFYAGKYCARIRTLNKSQLLGMAILVSLLMLSGLHSVKMFYEASLIIPLSVVATLLLLPSGFEQQLKYQRVIPGLLLLAIISQTNVLIKYTAYAFDTSPRQYDRVLEIEESKRLIMAGTGGHAQTKQQVFKAAALCDIQKEGSYIVTDMLTYGFFKNSYKPLSLDYIIGSWYSEKIDATSLEDVMQERRSSGAITLCAATPPTIREKMLQTDDFCCLKSLH